MQEKAGRLTPRRLPLDQAQISKPRHLLPPGEDGYRTPTIEDFEHGNDNQTQAFPPLPDGPSLPTDIHEELYRISSSRQEPTSLEKRMQSLEKANQLGWRYRVKHFTWAYFTLSMATGGICNVLWSVPYRFRGLTAIGEVFFIANIIFFISTCIAISSRFYYYPYTFKASICHPTESLFIPGAVVATGTILINISQYGLPHIGSWLNDTVEVLFWMYCAIAFTFSVGIYLTLWSTQYFSISQMTPIWIFPAYPLLIVGPHAGVLASQLRPERAFTIIVGGFTLQGIGFMVSLMVYSAFIYRLMTQKLPKESLRPGMFVSVGPSGFTVAGLINMAKSAQKVFPKHFMENGDLTATIFKVGCDWSALWLWGTSLALYFFFISVFAHYSTLAGSRMTFTMTWYSFVFPNTALISATFAVGNAFFNRAINIVACVMSCTLILTYLLVFGMMIRAVWIHDILWPQQGEDKDEGGFRVGTWKPEGGEGADAPKRRLTAVRTRSRSIMQGRRKSSALRSGPPVGTGEANGDATEAKDYAPGNERNV
ncbi:MAG: hypothetical protein Q9160_000015 [Pyrenula sp. 1 TL-2023]